MSASPRRSTDMAHLGGISVEGELGVLGSLETGMGEKEDGHGAEGKLSHDQLLTDPGRGREVRRRRPRSTRSRSPWAPATAPTSSPASRTATMLAMNVIEEIHRKLPNTHLVMHGSSSVPQDLQDIINQYRRQDEADLGRAGRGDPARHQARRAQDQHRHRQPHGDDRPDPQGAAPRTRASSIRAST